MSAFGFLDNLSSALFNQLGISENTPSSLDLGGSFDALGSFKRDIDRSAHRSYVEDGVVRNIKPRAAEILMQEPDITVVIKKRMFSSLTENYRTDLMDEKEKLFIRASKKLFQNKCTAISAYERLTKIDRIVAEQGFISDHSFPIIFSTIDLLENSGINNAVNGEVQAVLEKIRNVKKLSDPNFTTTWITDNDIPYASDTGDGTGTFEITTVQSISTTTSIETGGGSAQLTIQDPYKLMIMTTNDIELAISQAANLFNQSNFTKLTEGQLSKSISDLKKQLNNLRIARNASRILFSINENTILYKKIRAVIDEEGREIIFSFDTGTLGVNLFNPTDSSISLDPSAEEGINGLQTNEIGIFKQIIHNTYLLMGLKHTTRSDTKAFNEDMNYVRKKMMLHYANKPLIQPMDIVYIYASSKSQYDAKLTQGLKFNFSDKSIVNKINDTVGNINSLVDSIALGFDSKKSGEESFLEIEKNAIAGPEMPTWLWVMMRNQFIRQAAGTAIFVGPVLNSTHTYTADAGYSLSVNVGDNTKYFEICGDINVSPAMDVWNGPIYDPLTPFDFDFDSATGFIRGETPKLLDENIILLNSNSVRSKLGRARGKPLNTKDYVSKKDIEEMIYGASNLNQAFRRVYFDPDGFVYRWKEGIGSLVVSGEPHSHLGSFNINTSPNITKDPFAGQDVMNVISLLITGQPYNFNSYMQSALNQSKLTKDDLFNKGYHDSFLKGLTNDISRKNNTWGNFIPFKRIIINDKGYNFILKNTNETGFISLNDRISRLLEERARKTDLLLQTESLSATQISSFYTIGSGGAVTASSKSASGVLIGEIRDLSSQITAYTDKFREQLNKSPNLRTDQGTLNIFGNDISFDPSQTTETGANESRRLKERSEFRKKINYLTQRRLWSVKANKDINLFIVDDDYDKNYDIKAFERSLQGLELFKSNFENILQKIKSVATILNLEVFADSQGHIKARPPQYNRMPKRTFRAMLQKKAEKGIKIFPEYLEKLFFNKIESLTSSLEIVEDQIRLRAAALGYNTDARVSQLLSGNFGQHGKFNFVTYELSGEADWNLNQLFAENNPDLQEDSAKLALTLFSSKITNPYNATINFSVATRVDIVNENILQSSTFDQDRIDKISSRLKFKGVGNVPTSKLAILSTNKKTNLVNQVDIIKALNDISDLVAERQRVIKTLANSVRNLQEGLSVNAKNSNIAQSLLYPNVYSLEDDSDYPELLEHMIEDDSVDDLGENSGKRYVIEDSQIISFSLTESGPEYTAVQVDGALNEGLVDFPSSAALGSSFNGGGNIMGTAIAVDYDMWRMYGWRKAQNVQALFFSNPETQCAPYAVYLLNLARKNVFTATAVIAGNEFIQPGEVYYFEDMDLLFYTQSVQHSFTYGGTFQTTLQLIYGHNPGEYIPTPLDIIGGALYSNRLQANQFRHARHGRADNTNHIATLIHQQGSQTFEKDAVQLLLSNTFGEQNRKNLSNILAAVGRWFPPSDLNKKIKLKIRVYENKNPNINLSSNTTLQYVAGAIEKWIIDPRSVNLSGDKSLIDLDTPISGNDKPAITDNDIEFEIIDLDKESSETLTSPSSDAWAACKSILGAGAESNVVANLVESIESSQDPSYTNPNYNENKIANNADVKAKKWLAVLANSIIDVWAEFTEEDEVIESDDGQSESAVTSKEKIEAALEKRKAEILGIG